MTAIIRAESLSKRCLGGLFFFNRMESSVADRV
jgi:hypothetical protein